MRDHGVEQLLAQKVTQYVLQTPVARLGGHAPQNFRLRSSGSELFLREANHIAHRAVA
jgi:hypothetical protein